MDRAEQIDRAALRSRHLPAEQFRAGLDGRLRRAGERGQTYEKQKQADPPDGAMFHGGESSAWGSRLPRLQPTVLKIRLPQAQRASPSYKPTRRGDLQRLSGHGNLAPLTATLTIHERRHDWKA